MPRLMRYAGLLALIASASCAGGSAEQGGGADSGDRKVLPNQVDTGAPAMPAAVSTGTPGAPTSLDADGGTGTDTDSSVADEVPAPSTGGGGDDAGAGGADGFAIDWDALFPPPPAGDASASADGLSCANQGCFDIFDCALYHPAEFSACKYTQCVNLVCQ